MSPENAEPQRLAAEALKTTHGVIASFDTGSRGLEWLHGDLFDSRPDVATSAMEAIAARASPASFAFITRILASGSAELKVAAIRALGKIKHRDSGRALVDLLKTTRDEALRRELLDALASVASKDRDLGTFVRQIARSPLASAGARSHAVELLLRLRGEEALDELLADQREETTEQILRSASHASALALKTVAWYAPLYGHLPARQRATLVSIALANDLEASRSVLFSALSDPVAEVRRAIYAGIATAAFHGKLYPMAIEGLLGRVEANAALEDEAHEAIDRIAGAEGAAAAMPLALRGKVMGLIDELFRQLREEGRHIASESHELGWLIVRSKEYVEFYCDEEFKAALLRFLKGASTDSEDDLLKRLKATAVRVEVRHFDGYTTLGEIIKNPQRQGMALVARELALTKTGKGVIFQRLLRAIRLARAVFTSSTGSVADATLKEIYTWARGEKLFRLAEAALWAFARADAAGAIAACRDCLTVPLTSKLLAIASLHLLRELDPSSLEEATARLLGSQDDQYITMNAVEVLSTTPASASGDLAKSLLTRLSLAGNREVIEALVAHLGDKISIDIMESLRDVYAGGDGTRKSAVLAIMGRRISAGLSANRDGTIEFLYKILRGTDPPRRRAAGALLWKLKDDYAPEVMRDFLSSGTLEEKAETLRGLNGLLRDELLPSLAPLLPEESAVIQEPLRELLLGAGEEMRPKVLDLVLRLRGTPAGEDASEEFIEEPGAAVDFRTERTAFQFERENVQDLVILFTDIVGYSKKAQYLSPMEISTLIKDYEKILLALTEVHRGELVKRMGDGHLFVFHEPLHAVLAAIRLQKSLRRFNRYRSENSRVVIRIGIHCGSVVRKEQGDVLGNTVNIASRLETSSQPGSVLVSERVHEKVKDFIHAREIGRITVKNISEPIKVWEPFEIGLDIPEALDPMKGGRSAASAEGGKSAASAESGKAAFPEAAPPAHDQAGSAGETREVSVDSDILKQVSGCFESLEILCRDAHDGNVPLAPINEQVLARWALIRSRLPAAPRGA